MKYSVIQGQELPAELYERWCSILAANRAYSNPYFHPGFAQAVACVRSDVRIAVIESGAAVVGFFPFHRKRGGRGRPIGLALSDHHGVVAERDCDWQAEELLRACRLSRFEFDHLMAGQAPMFDSEHTLAGSPIVDLTNGYDALAEIRDKSGRKFVREIARKERKWSERAPLRFVRHASDPAALQTLLAWKSAQCHRTGTFDYPSKVWCAELFARIHASNERSFSGQLSCLYAGERLAAAHFAMRSESVLHSWIPAYDPEFSEFSPGLILLVRILRAGSEQGMDHLDFGKGLSLYKRRLMTGAHLIAEGAAVSSSLLGRGTQARKHLEAWARTSPLRSVLRLPGRLIHRLERRGRYD